MPRESAGSGARDREDVSRLDEVGGPAALTVVREAGRVTGWPDHWRAELQARRAAADPDVAEAARLVEPAYER